LENIRSTSESVFALRGAGPALQAGKKKSKRFRLNFSKGGGMRIPLLFFVTEIHPVKQGLRHKHKKCGTAKEKRQPRTSGR
jgi:hypothetical protein